MTTFSNAKEAVAYVENRPNDQHDFAYFKKCCEILGNPQQQLECIHVAGTNGKGSTTNYIRAILQANGYRVATFTSPYLVTHFDRIRINDINIPEETFLRILNTHKQQFDDMHLRMFEIDFLIAVYYFLEEQVDICVFEVGIGGRSDATNTIHASVGAITNIGKDHMSILGNTFEEIAYEKIGIVKQGMHIFTTEKKEECLHVFEKEVSKDYLHRVSNITIQSQFPNITYENSEKELTTLSTIARYQPENAELAKQVAKFWITKQKASWNTQIALQALHNTFWKGRVEKVYENPTIYIDGAHNVEGIQALIETFQGSKDIHIIFGVLKDKEFPKMFSLLETLSSNIEVCTFDSVRSIHKEDVDIHMQHHFIENWKQRIDEHIQDKHTLLVCGSLYFVSDVRKYILDKTK